MIYGGQSTHLKGDGPLLEQGAAGNRNQSARVASSDHPTDPHRPSPGLRRTGRRRPREPRGAKKGLPQCPLAVAAVLVVVVLTVALLSTSWPGCPET